MTWTESTGAPPEVLTGMDQLVLDRGPASLGARRVVYVGHAGATSWRFRNGLDELRALGLDVVGVITPEHGYFGAGQAGESGPLGAADDGPPHFDAYEREVEEIAAWLEDVRAEVVLVDLCDVGARCWTYLSTMQDALLAATSLGRPAVVLDRPNPLGGVTAAGPMLEDPYQSYVGRARVPLRHGLTLGELARQMQRRAPAMELEVVPVQGWERTAMFGDYGRSWVPPSPNLPSWETALAYPGTVLFEGTNVSEGRGTTRPFLTLGATFADRRWAEAVGVSGPDGSGVRAIRFVPTFGPDAGQVLSGIGLHVTDPTAFDPLRFAVVALVAALELYGTRVRFSPDTFDHLAGTAALRESLERGEAAEVIVEGWGPSLRAFEHERASLLGY